MSLVKRHTTLALALGALLAAACHAAATSTLAGAGQGRVAAPAGRQGGRVAPPSALGCSRDDTTAFHGRVLAYSRGGGRVRIRVRTDSETTEGFTLRYGRGGPESVFLINGGPFTAADWRRVESRPGRLRSNVRVIVWACYRGDEIVPQRIDFRPIEG
ncbi:MAG TPA: hypothetical protein VEY09_06495 [Pyrinomonadaceae bacterium]|nr:hypothetical protein [Pyrinomonadaceae bacterium]